MVRKTLVSLEVKGEAGGGALFDLLLEVQVVGVAILLVAVDSVGV